jgi:hypothetical protein
MPGDGPVTATAMVAMMVLMFRPSTPSGRNIQHRQIDGEFFGTNSHVFLVSARFPAVFLHRIVLIDSLRTSSTRFGPNYFPIVTRVNLEKFSAYVFHQLAHAASIRQVTAGARVTVNTRLPSSVVAAGPMDTAAHAIVSRATNARKIVLAHP